MAGLLCWAKQKNSGCADGHGGGLEPRGSKQTG